MAFGYIHFIRILVCILLASCTNGRGAFYDAAIGEFCEVHMECSEASSSNAMQDEPLNFCAKRVKQSEEVPSSLQCGPKFSKHYENGCLFGETSVTLVDKNKALVEDDQPSSSDAISFARDQNYINIYGMPLDPAESQTFVSPAESQMQCERYNLQNTSTTVTSTSSLEIPCCSNSLANPVQGLDNAQLNLPTVDLDYDKIQEWMDNGMHVQSSFVSMISTARKFRSAIKSLYFSQYGFRYADFYAFFEANSDLVIPPEKNSTFLYIQNFYAKYKLDEETRLRYMNICNILTGTVYRIQKECIENRIKNTIYKDSVRFLSTDQLKNETKTRFAMIYDPSSFDLIDQVFWNSVQVDYDTYLQKITELNDDNDICAVFTDFLTRNLFCKNNEHDLYVFKPQLRKLQLFMPELYFYVLWKIKTIANADSYTQCKDHCVKEMRHIKILLQFFYVLCGKTTDHSIFVRYIQDQVNFYRGFIMTYLNEQHPKTLAHLFFHQAFHSSTSQYDVAAKHCVRSLLYILAFTSKPSGFSKLTHEILKEPRSEVYNLNIGNFLHGKLLCVRCLKKETIATLLLVVSFLKEQNMPNTSDAYDLPVVLSFFETNTLVSYNGNDNLCDVYCMSRIEICLYLNNAIHDAIMNNK